MDREIAKTQEERKRMEQELYDKELYGGTDKDANVTSIPGNDEDNNDVGDNIEVARKLASYDDGGFKKPSRRIIDPGRHDAFAMGDKSPDPEVMREEALNRETEALKLKEISKKKKKRNRWDDGAETPKTPSLIQGGADGTRKEYYNNLLNPPLSCWTWEDIEFEERNRRWTDEELDAIFPQQGYEILEPPAAYVPTTNPFSHTHSYGDPAICCTGPAV